MPQYIALGESERDLIMAELKYRQTYFQEVRVEFVDRNERLVSARRIQEKAYYRCSYVNQTARD